MGDKPKKWTDTYPQGTAEGNEECRFFKALARNKDYKWRSVSALSKESGLSLQRVEEILNKYYKKNMVFMNPKGEEQWGYWERIPQSIWDVNSKKSIARDDQDARIENSKS
ncbi:MAG: hypothetical protein DWQ19_11940 [Crenarchaeota archaeon]|nr:MAG: hypothetical protein DWQ19_11940 [Thermoproteota archaeon]